MPANQNGEIQLRSTLHIFTFHADSSGHVSVPIVVPRNIGAGDHTVTICWTSRCRNSVTVHVVEPGVASASPTSGTTPGATRGSSPSPNTTPGSSPAPTGGTSGSPRPSPISTPKSTPSPPPPPPPSPTPTPSPYVTLNSISSLGNTVVTFHYFYGGSTSVAVCQGTTCHPAGTVTVAQGSYVMVSFKTPVGIVAAPLGEPAYVATGCCGHTGTVSVGV